MPKSLIAKTASILIIVVLATELASVLVPLPAIKPTLALPSGSKSQLVSLPWPSIGQSAIGAVDFGLLAASGEQKPVPIASVAKIITALAVLSKKPLKNMEQGPTITLTAADVDNYQSYLSQDGSVVAVTAGEQLTERQALEAMLLPSANNMAYSLANWAFGSLDNYMTYANQFVKKLGLTQTTVTDASGFLPTTVSTATDLVRLAEAAMNNPALASIVAEKQADLPVAGTVNNTNWLLGTDGIMGIKTGNTDEAGGCFMFAAAISADQQVVTLIGAVANAPNLVTAMNTARVLVNASRSGFSTANPVAAGQTVAVYKTAWAGDFPAVAKLPLSLLTWHGQDLDVKAHLKSLSPSSQTASVGTISAISGSRAANVTVNLKSPIKKPPIIWRLLHASF